MPLSGGPSEKAGNSYERRWTVFVLLDLLEGKGQSVRIEVPGEEGVGAEFRVLSSGEHVWHQVKRQRAAGPWTIASMANEGVLEPWWPQIQAGGRCVFVSSTGAQELQELVERAGSANSWSEFESEFLTGKQSRRFQRLRTAWGDPPEEDVYRALARIEVRLLGERELAGWIDARIAALVMGPPQAAAAVLAQLVDDSRHRELPPSDIWERLAANGIEPRNLSLDEAVVRRIGETVDLYIRRIGRSHIGGRELQRKEADVAFEDLLEGHSVLIAGAAGTGKSVIASQVAQRARQAGWPVLVLSVDRLPDAETAYALGTARGLPDSPTTVLAGVSGGGDALLVLDQLDAVSVASGRHPERLAIIEELLGQAESHSSLRVLLACRQFDLENDRTLRRAATASRTSIVSARGLEIGEVKEVLADAGLPSKLPESLADLLTVPLHLAIYVELALTGVSETPLTNATRLYNEYWNAKRQACRLAREGEDQWLDVVDRMVERMSREQKLAIPASALDDLDEQARVMESQGVLTRDAEQIAFFHEAFFDYCFARRFVAAGRKLRELLETEEQDLFRRAQVRQILTYERETAFDAYLTDLTWLLTAPDVRHHIKALVVALAQTLHDPERDEWLALRTIAIKEDHPLHNRLWQSLRSNPGWFPVLEQEDEWARWLDGSDPAVTDRTIWALGGMASHHPEEVSTLLHGIKRDEQWPNRLRGFLRLTDAYSNRSLFDLFLEGVRDGFYREDYSRRDFWQVMRGLASGKPEWAVEALDSVFAQALEGGADNPFKDPGPLSADRHSLADETLLSIAQRAPHTFIERLLPHLFEIVRRNARPEWSGGDVLLDTVWGMRIFGAHTDLKDVFRGAIEDALRALARDEPDYAATMFERLRADPHATAWFLLARGYEANPERFADDAATWLANTPGTLHLGYSDAPHWVSRELVAAISQHCSQAQLDRLTAGLINYAPPYERRYEGIRQRGRGELCLLNAIDPARRSETAEKRLAELRRKFLVDDVEPPKGIQGGVVPPPIPEDRARRMTDKQWLRAIARHGISDTRFAQDGRLIGDAGSQAQVLEALTRDSPNRFARLLLEFPDDVAEPYLGGVLRGLAGSRLEIELLLSVCRRAREIGGSDTNRWVVRLIESEAAATLPNNALDIVADIAIGDPDPREDAWRKGPPGSTPLYGGDPDSAGLNCTRGAAAWSIAELIREESNRLPRLKEALENLAADNTIQVRAMTAYALTVVLYVDADFALNLFNASLMTADDELLGSRHVEGFVNHAIRRRHYSAVVDVISAMRSSTSPDVRSAGARQLAVASYIDPDLDSVVDGALDGDESMRSGVVEVYAENFHRPVRRDRAVAVLNRAFDDPSSGVRSAALQCFRDLKEQALQDFEPLLNSLAKSQALQDDPGIVFANLEAARKPLPKSVLDLCAAFVELYGADLADISTSAAGQAIHIVQLAIRLHAQHADPETRRRCLDLIDKLVVLGAYGIDKNLALIER